MLNTSQLTISNELRINYSFITGRGGGGVFDL